ncbi:glutamate--tRNA ligase [Buchnera aphidicola]|uniref:Glutamate--tRNA ligase n=1 Tax=Buchnera aphidicola (Sarucallis kahawaluokalani) TaxID=1241878 RepID=A0A4D6YJG8_9GAMM|nr:glutamate--tRNA ligase [Buchnera aphidicola]QCI25858.1 glutamate--tRNA ligase [Buchnera aphidicola (Sarucallis kahawaluokalani)]
MDIKTRFAPSPTGFLHIGSVRTALYSWLFAKRYNGSFILRIEDTDIIRSDKNYIENILDTLHWLGITWDEGPYFQSERLEVYRNKINELLDLGHAYRCYCSTHRLKKLRLQQMIAGDKPRYDRKCRDHTYSMRKSSYVIRFKNPLHGKVIFHDQIRGKIIFKNSELDDLIIQRRNGMPTYNFCVVIDDLDMNITDVIRGEDHINNTPRQINILQALNVKIPNYAHVSMVINDDKSNFSKRDNSLNVLEYKKRGFLCQAVLNYLIKLGWSHKDQEIFNVYEMKELFSLRAISKSPSTFNVKKLLWYNQYYLNKLSINDSLINQFIEHLKSFNIYCTDNVYLFKIINFMRSRCNTLQDLVLQSRFFFEPVNNVDMQLVRKYLFDQSYYILKYTYYKLQNLNIWDTMNITTLLKYVAKKFSVLLKNICMPLRIAITGSDISPNVSAIMEIFGKENTLHRLKKYYHFLKKCSL